MASGNSLCAFTALDNQAPTSAFATLDVRNAHPVLDFDADTDENAVFGLVLPRHYAGGGLTVSLYWMASSATTGDVKWDVAIERHQADTDDLDSDTFASAQTTTVTTVGTSGAVNVDTVAFTSGAQMDSLAAGESFRIKVTRDANAAGDTMSGDAEILRVEIRET